jgi:Methyltransferase domain
MCTAADPRSRSNLRGVPPELLTRWYRWLRIRLPQPWSRRVGQLAYLPRLARGHAATLGVFAEEPLIERLALGTEPLADVGPGLSERVVEIPWVLRSLPSDRDGRILDVGTAFALIVYKWLLVRQPHTIEVADLADAYVPGLRSHVADVRRLPFASDSFDVATCISTLEHVGMNNSDYGVESGGGGEVDALRELGRVAGRVLVTVPAGRDEDMGWQRQYAPSTFRRVVADAGLTVERLEVFAHDPASGWGPAREDSVDARTYGQDAAAAAAIVCAELSRP